MGAKATKRIRSRGSFASLKLQRKWKSRFVAQPKGKK
jgi:hypothetical protein